MADAIYEWMKNLAVFYIFLTVLMNLVPDAKYGEHIKFFMGLLLLFLLLSPFLQVFQMKSTLEELFRQNIQEQERLDSAFDRLQSGLEKQQEELRSRLDEKYTEQSGEGRAEEE